MPFFAGNKAGEGRAYGNMSNAYAKLGDRVKDLDYQHKKLELTQQTGAASSLTVAYTC